MNQIEIFEFIGCSNEYALHSTEQVLAIEQGCSLLLWNITIDQKVRMHSHDSDIKQILFCGRDDSLLASISAGVKSQLLISQWNEVQRKYQIYLPSNHRKERLRNVFLRFDDQRDLFIILEVEQSGYRLSTWLMKGNELKLQFMNDLEQQNSCLFMLQFNSKKFIKIATVEQNLIKYWCVEQNKAVLTNRIIFQNDIQNAQINTLINILVIITIQGVIYIINDEGELLSQLKSDQHFLTCSTWESYILVGCKSGMIVVYEANSLNYVKSMNLHPDSLNQVNECGQCYNCDAFVVKIVSSYNGNIIIVLFSDGVFLIYDSAKSKLIGINRGHTQRINQLIWDGMNKGLMCYSVSNDGKVGQMELRGNKFNFQSHNVSNPIDEQLSKLLQPINMVQLKQQPKQLRLKIKSLAIDHYREEIYLGNNKGQLIIHSLPDMKFRRCVSLAEKLSIVYLQFSPAYQYLGVVFSSGFTILIDCDNQLKPMIKLEDHHEDINLRNKQFKAIKLFQNDSDLLRQDFFSLKLQTLTSVSQANRRQYNIPRQDKNFQSLTLYDKKSVRQYQILQDGQILSALAINIFTIDAQINSFDLHPSNEYIIILSISGIVSIYKLQTGEIRGKIQVPMFSRYLTIDPSGLYFAIANLHTIQEDKDHGDILNNNLYSKQFKRQEYPIKVIYENFDQKFLSREQNLLPTNIRIYEIGTGKLAGQVKSVYQITRLDFSPNGEFLISGGKMGRLAVWSCDDEIFDSIKDVLEQMRLNPLFWQNYPINLIDTKDNIQDDTLDLSIIQTKDQIQRIQKS